MRVTTRLTSFAAALAAIVDLAVAVNLTVSPTGGHATSTLLYGILYEEIYHSGDGGIYSELIRNRAFQGSDNNGAVSTTRTLDYWHAVESASIALDTTAPPVSSALPTHMRITFPTKSTGWPGVYNDGFWGMDITTAMTYAFSFYLRGTYNGYIGASFYSSANVKIGGVIFWINQVASQGWVYTSAQMYVWQSATDAKSTFRLEFDGGVASGQSIDVNLISVAQQTFRNQPNGLRQDLANTINAMNAKFLRMPGGNFLEGFFPYRLKWNDTVGPLLNRPGHPGVWGGYSTDGLGLLELAQWAVDMGQTIILGVWAGLYLSGQVVAPADLQPYINDVLNELEFLTGSTSTKYGALRASYGYPTPFNISYIEIGNEDYLNGGWDSYVNYRFPMFYQQLSAKYPNVNYISTIGLNAFPKAMPGVMQDDHLYLPASSFASSFNWYDQTSRNTKIFIAEYAAVSDANGGVNNPTLDSATAEAVFLLGMERNSDVIVGTSYGALIKNENDQSPNSQAVIKHTANAVVPSISYFVQQLFASNFGTRTMPITSTTNPGPLFWSATASDSGTAYVKLVNYNGASTTSMTITLTGNTKTSGVLKVLSAPSPSSHNELNSIVSTITQTTVKASTPGVFTFTLNGAYLSAVLVV